MATHSSVLAWRIPVMAGAWWSAVYGVAQSRTQLKLLSSSSSSLIKLALMLYAEMVLSCYRVHLHLGLDLLQDQAMEQVILSTKRTLWGMKIKFSLKALMYDHINSVQFSRSVVSNSLQPQESQHARPPCRSPTSGVHSDSCPLSQ